MIDDERLAELLRTAMPPVLGGELARDLWPQLAGGDRPAHAASLDGTSRDGDRSAEASRYGSKTSRYESKASHDGSMARWFDLALAAAAIAALLLLPGSLVLLAYHL